MKYFPPVPMFISAMISSPPSCTVKSAPDVGPPTVKRGFLNLVKIDGASSSTKFVFLFHSSCQAMPCAVFHCCCLTKTNADNRNEPMVAMPRKIAQSGG